MAIELQQNIATFELPRDERLAVDYDLVGGRPRITFRVWYLDKNDGQHKAGRGGFSLDLKTALELLKVKIPTEVQKEILAIESTATTPAKSNGGGRKF